MEIELISKVCTILTGSLVIVPILYYMFNIINIFFFSLVLDGYLREKYGDLIKDMTETEPTNRIKLDQVIKKISDEGSSDEEVFYDFME